MGRRTTRRTVVVMTDRRGLRRPILGAILLLLSSFPRRQLWRTVISTMVRRGSRFKILQLLESGYWDHFSDLHDELAGRTVIAMTDRHNIRNPTLVRLPHLPWAASLRCHLRTVTCTTDRHKLRRWSLLHFSLKISAFSFGQISCKTKRNLYKN